MSKNDDSERKIINSYTKMLVDISKIKSSTSNLKQDEYKKLVDAIFLYHNVQNFQPDILKNDKKFNQLYSTFLETVLTFFPQLAISNQLIRSVTRNFTWYAKSTGTLPYSHGYCHFVCQVLLYFQKFTEDKEISEFFETVFQVPSFIASFFFTENVNFFVNMFFYQIEETESILFFINLLRKKAVFPNTADSMSYLIIHQFAQEVDGNKLLPEARALLSINFISMYIEKLSRSYPNLINDLFFKNDFNIFYTYLADHLQDDSFIQFIVSLLSIPSTTPPTLLSSTASPNSTSADLTSSSSFSKQKDAEKEANNLTNATQSTTPNSTIFNFIIQQFVKKSVKYEIHLRLIQSLYYFISEYNVNVNSFVPQNFFVILYNIPTHDIPEIKNFLLDFFDMLVTYNYEFSFIIFANYLNEYKKNCPFKRLSFILQRLITTFQFSNFNANQNSSNNNINSNNVSNYYYLQNLPFFFVDSFGDSPQSLGEFLAEYPIFQMLIVVLYQYNYSFKMNDPNPRLTWMKKIIECSNYFDHSNILIQMLTVDPSGDLINKYISILKDHFSPSLFDVLTTTLHQSYFLVEQFLQFRGLQTIDKILPSLDDDLLTNLLVSISSHPFSDELNESILNLPNDHIFFHLKSAKNYYKILRNSPIRLPVFLPFVPAPPITYSQFDLMNISKYAVPIYQRFNKKVPFVFNLINRHLTYRQASEILRNNKFFLDDQSYCSLGDLIDLKADHFPLYEFLPNSQNVCINLSVEVTEKAKKSLLFWFKIISPIYQPFSLFHTEKKTLMIENDILKIDSNHSLKIERNVWHSVIVSNKSVKIDNQSVFNFQDTSAINQCIFGQSNVDSLWILSPNVRIIEINSIEDVLSKGPQFITQNEKYPIVPIPNESMLVDYAGLPYYFTIPSFFKNEFLNVIENCNDNNQIVGLFLLFFNVMIVNNYIEKHWPFVLHLLSTKTKYLNNYLISYVINFISSHYSPKIFESFILNASFWKNLPNRLLGYTLNNLLSHSNNHSNTIFEFFISLLLLEISTTKTKVTESSLSSSSSTSMDDSTIQIILFFLSRLSSQFPNENFLKQLIEIVLFSEKYTFSLTVRLFFIQTALQNDIELTSKSMPRNWILKLLSYFPNNNAENNSDIDTFYFAVFNLLSHFSDSDIHNNFPQDSFDTSRFIFNSKYWHYFFALLTGQPPHFTQSIINEYSKESTTKIKMPSIIPSIISLTLHGLAVLVHINFNPYQSNPIDKDLNRIEFLGEYVSDSFKLLNQICERLPHLFHNDSICLFIQTICPLIPNLEAIFIPNVQLSHYEKFCVNMNDQELILNETLETWKIKSTFQREIISIRPEISRFSLQSHSIIIPERKCEIYSKCISNLIKTVNQIKPKNNLKNDDINTDNSNNKLSSFKHILKETNFTQFSVNLLFANSDKFQELILYLFGFCPFNPIKLFDEYFKLPFQIFISQLNKENLNQNLFEQILKFIIQGFKVNILYNVFSSSLNLLFMFLNNALDFISLDPNQSSSSNQNESTNANNAINITNSGESQNDENTSGINESSTTSLVKLVREMVLLITKTGVQKLPNEIIQFLLDSKNIIENEIIFSSHQMICQMISCLHVFYLSNISSSSSFLKLLKSIWPTNDQSFKAFFVTNYSNKIFEAFQNATIESDISYLTSLLKNDNSSTSFMNLLAVSNSESDEESSLLNEANQILDSSISGSSLPFELYANRVYEIEKRGLRTKAEFSFLETAIDCSANLKTVLYLHRSISSYEKNYTKYLMLDFYTFQQNLQNYTTKFNRINKDVLQFAWPFWISRILSPSYDIERNQNNFMTEFKIKLNDSETSSNNSNGMKHSFSFENNLNHVLIDYYSGNLIESEPNFNFIIFVKLYIHKIQSKIYAFNAQFIKNDIEINTSVFILENKILLLLNSSIGEKLDRLVFTKVESEEKLRKLYKMIFNFEFGKFSIFHSHPLLTIPLNSILCTFENDQDLLKKNYGTKNDKINLNLVVSLHVYSLKCSAFSLVASKKDLNNLISSARPFIKSNLESYSNIQNVFSCSSNSELSASNFFNLNKMDSNDLFYRYENHQIAPFELFILLNAIHGRFFDDWKNLPIFPKILPTSKSNFLTHNQSIVLKKGPIQCMNVFQYYAPDFLGFSRTTNANKNASTNGDSGKQNGGNKSGENEYKKSVIFLINNDVFDMVKIIFDNLSSLSSKTLVSSFISHQFGETLSKPAKTKTSLNIKSTASKIKKSFLKGWESSNDNSANNSSNNNNNSSSNNNNNENSDDEDANQSNQQNSSSSKSSNHAELKRKLQRFLSSNPRLFSFQSSSSFRQISSESGHVAAPLYDSISSSSSPSSSSPSESSVREFIEVSQHGSFAVVDCPLRCCSEAFRIFYDDKNREQPAAVQKMSTFAYYDFIREKTEKEKQNESKSDKTENNQSKGSQNDEEGSKKESEANEVSQITEESDKNQKDSKVIKPANDADNATQSNEAETQNGVDNAAQSSEASKGTADTQSEVDSKTQNNEAATLNEADNTTQSSEASKDTTDTQSEVDNKTQSNEADTQHGVDNAAQSSEASKDTTDTQSEVDSKTQNNEASKGTADTQNEARPSRSSVSGGTESNRIEPQIYCELSSGYFSCYSNPRTIVNEHDLVAVTFWTHSAVIWDVIRGLPLHVIDFTSHYDIIDGIFDESHGLIAFCSPRSFFVYTVNGSFVMQSSLIDECSVIKSVLTFDGFKIDYKTAQNEEKTHVLYLFVNEIK